jgi:WD40 repeat protein
MSPEQAEGRLDQVGPLSDVYSLGATLYCLLTGRPPLGETDVGEALRRAQRGEFPPPRAVRPGIPQGLEAICLKAMALKPEGRYPSAPALAEDLEHWLADEPISAYRDPPAVRLTRWGRRHRTAAVGIGALLVTAVAALVVSNVVIGYQKQQTELQRQDAEAQRAIAARRADDLDRQLYVDRVNRAYPEWETNNIALTERLVEECPPGRRGWEWSFVRRLCHLDKRTDRDAELVQALAFSPDGRTVAAGGGKWPGTSEAQGELVLRDTVTGKERFAPLRGLPTIIVGLAFSPGGDRLVSAGVRQGAEHKGELTLWDARTGRVLDTQPERDLAVLGVAISRDGRYVAASYGVEKDDVVGAGHVKVWEVSTDTLKPIDTLTDPDHPGPVNGVAFDPDGRIATAGLRRVRIWDKKGAAWSPGRVLPGHTGNVFAVAFRPDGKQLATAGWDYTARLWDPDTGREVRALYGHTGFVRCLAYSADSRHLATGSEDRSILLWDTATGRPEATYRGHQAFVMALAFHPDGRLASGGTDRLVKTWDLAGGQPLAFRENGGWVVSLDFSPDGARVVSGGGFTGRDWSVRVWDAATGRRLQSYEGHRATVVGVRFRPDGRHVVSFSFDATVRVWDATTGLDVAPPLDVSLPPPTTFNCSAIRPDGREFALGASDGTVRLWDLETGRVRRTLAGHTGKVVGLAYDRSGLRLASTSALGGPSRNDARPGGELKLWDVASGRELATPRRGIDVFQCLAFSPDGHRLVLSSGFYGELFGESREAYVWDAATGRTLLTLRGHTSNVHRATFSPDGMRIATASIDRTVKLWDAASGEEVFTLRGHTAGVLSVAFSPDGHRLASGGIDWTARVWDARPPDDEPRSPPH